MTVFHELYRIGFWHKHKESYRNKLKKMLPKVLDDSLKSTKIYDKTLEVVIHITGSNWTAVIKDKTAIVKQAVEYFREDSIE